EKVDPRTQPGSKLIVVKKNSAAGSRKANIVAAERAMKLGRYAAAAEMYEALYARSKRDPAILMGRALAYQRLGQHDMAVESYERLLDIRPKNLEARVNMLGIIGQRYPAVAARQLLDLREEYPDNVGLVAQVAVMQAKLQNFDEAVRYLGIAASMEPQNASHVFNMAVIADKAGDKKKAIEYYEEALEVDSIYGKGATIPRDSVFERLAALR
ncbi:MAG: tetratricopeptide repeat protein, partial [Bdellovibrionales bacterium]